MAGSRLSEAGAPAGIAVPVGKDGAQFFGLVREDFQLDGAALQVAPILVHRVYPSILRVAEEGTGEEVAARFATDRRGSAWPENVVGVRVSPSYAPNILRFNA